MSTEDFAYQDSLLEATRSDTSLQQTINNRTDASSHGIDNGQSSELLQ
jgi:hypothetical protein